MTYAKGGIARNKSNKEHCQSEIEDKIKKISLSPIHLCEVKRVLRKCSSISAPGVDNITYFHRGG